MILANLIFGWGLKVPIILFYFRTAEEIKRRFDADFHKFVNRLTNVSYIENSAWVREIPNFLCGQIKFLSNIRVYIMRNECY